MNNSDMPAAPISEEETDRVLDGVKIFTGLTKREYFAAKAMQGILAKYGPDEQEVNLTANDAVKHADALLKELKEEG